MASTLGIVLGLTLASPASPAAATPWLFLSDIHLDPTNRSPVPVAMGDDTNAALLDSAIDEMKRVDPEPPVVVITGDFLAHHFDYAHANSVMQGLAQRFDRAFPHAQFVIALGNEDSGCSDYSFAPNSAFAQAVTAAWAPLVNRHGAAPGFATTFARDGSYTANLPIAHTQAVVVDDVYWSPRYHSCGAGGGGARAMTELRSALLANRDKHWVVAHIPPGIDAYSTARLTHGFAIIPFLDPDQRAQFVSLLEDPGSNVSLVLLAHTHKFAFRIAGSNPDDPIPMLLIPAISPIFDNAPSFLAVDVDATGTIQNAEDHAYLNGSWSDIGGTKTLGLSAFTGPNLIKLHEQLENDPDLRATFARLYEAGAPPEINERNWRTYWCAATEFSTGAFRSCTSQGGFSILTRRGIWFIVAAIVALALVVGLIVAIARRRRRPLLPYVKR